MCVTMRPGLRTMSLNIRWDTTEISTSHDTRASRSILASASASPPIRSDELFFTSSSGLRPRLLSPPTPPTPPDPCRFTLPTSRSTCAANADAANSPASDGFPPPPSPSPPAPSTTATPSPAPVEPTLAVAAAAAAATATGLAVTIAPPLSISAPAASPTTTTISSPPSAVASSWEKRTSMR